jgi:hypothetical protein
VIVLCSLTNATINQHFHKLSSGEIIEHAHPFKKGNTGNPFQEHNHTSEELILLAQISNPVLLICLFLMFLAPLLIYSEVRNAPLIITFKNPDLYFLKNYHAPPVVSY